MKKILLFSLICLMALTANAQWVDLGLPSGTLWKEKNEEGGFYTYDRAKSKFGDKLPTRWQFEELKNSCQWTWTGKGYKVVGPNGKSIFLPASGVRYCEGEVSLVGSYGYYLSSEDHLWYLCFNSRDYNMYNWLTQCDGHSVRLVQKAEANADVEAKYVDLGLPSGTLWKNKNEEGWLYTFDQAVSKYRNSLPSKVQIEELKDFCQWTWTGSGYKVVGPNGNSIVLPAAGSRYCRGDVDHVGSSGYYWSSTPWRSGYVESLSIHSDRVSSGYFETCWGLSVRLVQNVEAKYVDLGLPSGTLWKVNNEDDGFYTYNQAISKFGDKLPTMEQLVELKKSCQWTWTGRGYKVVGPNGQSIYLPAAGYRDCRWNENSPGYRGYYWSSTTFADAGRNLYFNSGEVHMDFNDRCCGIPVRLVKDTEVEAKYVDRGLPSGKSAQNVETEYVDLGLPSGTLWKKKNEDVEFYTFGQAVSKFGDSIPTKIQFEELKNNCQWTWMGNGYKVVGPNGNSIVLPAAGFSYCDGDVGYVGSYGYYWSSTTNGSNHWSHLKKFSGSAWHLSFDSDYVGMENSNMCAGQFIRLVQGK